MFPECAQACLVRGEASHTTRNPPEMPCDAASRRSAQHPALRDPKARIRATEDGTQSHTKKHVRVTQGDIAQPFDYQRLARLVIE